MMRSAINMLILIMICGCTTYKPVELSPEDLQIRILGEELIRVGNKIEIVTSDGLRHEFTVTAIEDDHLFGKDVDIPISNIIALRTKEFSGGKTSALAGGLLIIFQLIAAVAAVATFGF